ncbi:15-hydroxyprostaglandin dehydrogenase [NAD(+)]-like isoform X2 [Leguminivora glycinivorella]|uniref:15-hydroxyprostaglandin dehydrogenase [NAD(+)]-like isoform X2 n=1 Tax=Leguminivora glycinivorella TaxID=1035111 RepID=UPI00200FB13C|nr:15-hydroxyprostaglandin dehydrogenase [NAD(+)]-like isoform X2 [Leguminivora glycinivorella]
MSYEWRNKVVMITGAANGIGACVVKLVLEEGAKHIAILDVDETSGNLLQDELNTKYGFGKTRFYYCDVTNDDQLIAAFHSLLEEKGNIDVVINNAAIMNDKVYRKEIEINLTSLVTSTLKALELMRVDEGGKGGTIVNVSSTAALLQSSLMPVYFGTKAAVLQFSNCIGKEKYFTKTGVRVLTVCFGPTTTELVKPTKLGSLDKNVTPEILAGALATKIHQKIESAAAGLVAAYKRGASGSTWLATRDLPVKDITDNVVRAYQILGEFN